MTIRIPVLLRATPALLVGAALLATGCGKKSPAASAATSGASAAAGAMSAQMPATKDAATFAGKLVATTVNNWEPISDGGDVNFTYKTMTFSPDGSWTANAELEASFEKIGCNEKGSWAIEEATSANEATMVWKIASTNCPMREAGKDLRVQVQLPKANSYTINFR